MKRTGVILAALVAGVAVAAVAGVAIRDAQYWDRPLPGVHLREASLSAPVEVTVGGKTHSVRPGETLMVDAAATQSALVRTGHDSFLRRVRQLVDPSPPILLVDPVLVPRPGATVTAARLSAGLPKPRRAQIVSRGGEYSVIPSRPGETIDPTQLFVSLGTAALTGERTLTPALTHVEPELQTSAAEEAIAEAKELVSEPIALSFQDGVVGTLAPQRLAKLVRFRPNGSEFRVTFAPDRIAKAVEPFLSDWRRRAVNAQFIVDGKTVRIRPSQPGLAPDGRWISDSISAAATSSIRLAV